jgi:hypothetical protein
MTEVSTGKIKIVPDFLVTGDGGQGGNLFNAWMTNMVTEQVTKRKEEKKEE